MKQYSKVKSQYNLTFKGLDATEKIQSKSFENTTAYINNIRFKFNLNGAFNQIQLGENAKVSIDSVFVPSHNLTTVPITIIRLRGVSDNIYDTEQGICNNPIIAYTNTNDKLFETNSLKYSKSYRIPQDFFKKGYIEFDIYVEDSTLNKDVVFAVNSFMVSMVVYEDDFEESTDLITAPQVVEGQQYKLHSNFYPNYNNNK